MCCVCPFFALWGEKGHTQVRHPMLSQPMLFYNFEIKAWRTQCAHEPDPDRQLFGKANPVADLAPAARSLIEAHDDR